MTDPERLAQLALAGVVQIVDQRERPGDVDLAALVVTDQFLGDRQSFHQVPQESDVDVMLGALDGAVERASQRSGARMEQALPAAP